MNEDDVKEWLLQTVRLIVDYPDRVEVIATVSEDGRITFRIKAATKDVGKIIGRQARMAQSIRVLVHTMGMKTHTRFTVDIDDGYR